MISHGVNNLATLKLPSDGTEGSATVPDHIQVISNAAGPGPGNDRINYNWLAALFG